MNRLLNRLPFINGRMNKRTVNRLIQNFRGKRNSGKGFWLSVAALAVGGAAYGMQRKQINQGIKRIGQTLMNQSNN